MNKPIPSPKGMHDPRRQARAQTHDKPEDMTQTPSNGQLRQPHERDEAPDAGTDGVDDATTVTQPELPQAHRDIEAGRRDTERRGIPSDVPSSKKNRGS